jgi:hypothetical protein
LWLKYEFGELEGASIPEGHGSRRCTGPEGRAECDAFIRGLPVYRTVATRSDGDVQVGFDPQQK